MNQQCCEHCETAGEDHDMLIKMDTKLDRAMHDIKNALMNSATKTDLANGRDLDEKVQEDHEKRLRILEKWVWMAIGALTLLNFVGLSGLLIHLVGGGKP